MPGFQMAPVNYGSLISAQQPNPLLQILQAAGQYPQQKEQHQLDALQVPLAEQQIKTNDQNLMDSQQKYKMNEQAYQQNEQVNAQQQAQFMGQQLLVNPSLATPATGQTLTRLGTTLGNPSMFVNSDGTPNLDMFRKPYSSLTPDDITKLRSMSIAARTDALKNYSGVPDDIRTAPQESDPKTAADIARIGAEIQVDKSRVADNNSETALHKTEAAVDKAKSPFEIQHLQAQAFQEYQSGNAAARNAQSHAEEANASMMRAQAAITKATDSTGQALAVAQFKDADKDIQKADSAVQGSLAQIKQMANAQGVSVTQFLTSGSTNQDPAIQQAANKLIGSYTEAAKALAQAKAGYKAAAVQLSTNPGYVAYIRSLSNARGVSVTDTTPKRNGGMASGLRTPLPTGVHAKPGDTITNKSGKKYTVNGDGTMSPQ